MYHVGIDASPPPIRYRSIMNDTIDTYLIPDRRFSLCRYLADTVTAPSGPIPFGYRGASVSASVSAMADTRYQHICICRARCEQTAKLSIPPKSGNNKYQLSIERCFGIVSLARSGDGATPRRVQYRYLASKVSRGIKKVSRSNSQQGSGLEYVVIPPLDTLTVTTRYLDCYHSCRSWSTRTSRRASAGGSPRGG